MRAYSFTHALVLGLVAHVSSSSASRVSVSIESRDNAEPYPNHPTQKFSRLVALGDSYSAGPGYGRVGNPITHPPGPTPPYANNCHQNDGAWPAQLAGLVKPMEFQFSACTGYNSTEIRNIQILDPLSNFGNPDLVTLTFGGNNNDAFLNVVVNCPFGLSTSKCTDAITDAQTSINSIDQELNDTIMSALTHNLGSKDPRTVLVMGYPQLYNNGTSFWLNCVLSSSRRKSINGLIAQMNAKLQTTVDIINDQVADPSGRLAVVYADPNTPDAFAKGQKPADRTFSNHHFCELWNWAYLNGGAPPENFLKTISEHPPDVSGLADPFSPEGLALIGDVANVAFLYGIGLFHPIYAGHQVMADAALNVLSTVNRTDTSNLPSSPGQYIIVPLDTANSTARTAFASTLAQTLGTDSNITTLNDPTDGPLLWKVQMTVDQIKDVYYHNDIVASIAEDPTLDAIDETPDRQSAFANSLTASSISQSGVSQNSSSSASNGKLKQRGAGQIITQKLAASDLAALSQGRTYAWPGSFQDTEFFYDTSAGEGSTVYVIDTGANGKHPEIQGHNTEFLYTVMADETETDTGTHGTCVASLAVGPLSGTAKKANLVVVKFPKSKGTFDLINALILVRNHIKKNNRQKRAVINYSGGINGDVEAHLVGFLRNVLKDLRAMDVPIILAAGNRNYADDPLEPTANPQIMVSELSGIINVGMTDKLGYISQYSRRGPLVNLWAPGYQVACANAGYNENDPDSHYAITNSGTSMSAPRVAGIAAYMQAYYGFTLTADEVIDNLNLVAFPRFAGGPEVASNGYNARCKPLAGSERRSLDSRAYDCSLNATAMDVNVQDAEAKANFTDWDLTIGAGESSDTNVTNPALSGVTCSTNQTGGSVVVTPDLVTEWCTALASPQQGCDKVQYNGNLLADETVCGNHKNIVLRYIGDQKPKGSQVSIDADLTVTLSEGSSFVFNSTACSSALNSILQGCGSYNPPPGATTGSYQWIGQTEVVNATSGSVAVLLNLSPSDPSAA